MAGAVLFSLNTHAADLRVRVTDAQTGKPLAARVYIKGEKSGWYFPGTTDPKGSVVRYLKTNWLRKDAFENHSSVSAHPFQVHLEPGGYTLTVVRGKEYFTATQKIQIGVADKKVEIKLRITPTKKYTQQVLCKTSLLENYDP